MGGCPVVQVPGRTFPVTARFLEDVVELTRYRLEPSSDSPYVARGMRGPFFFFLRFFCSRQHLFEQLPQAGTARQISRTFLLTKTSSPTLYSIPTRKLPCPSRRESLLNVWIITPSTTTSSFSSLRTFASPNRTSSLSPPPSLSSYPRLNQSVASPTCSKGIKLSDPTTSSSFLFIRPSQTTTKGSSSILLAKELGKLSSQRLSYNFNLAETLY